MRKSTPKRNTVASVAVTLVTFSLGLMLAVSIAGSASAKTPPKTSPKKATTTSSVGSFTTTAASPADNFSVINGTVNAASDHEIVGSSAFPNFTTGAVDNYYTLAHSHVDNSPFAEGTASPFDTGPVGQTAAAGNFQQPQYADARWPGGPDKATYGSQGGPYAAAAADNNRAKADAEEPSNAFSGPGLHGTKTLALPLGFDDRLRQALAAWNAKWDGRLGMKSATPTATTPVPTVTVPKAPVAAPSVTVTTPNPAVGGVTVPSPPKLPSAGAMGAPRSMASVTVPQPPASLPKPRSQGSSSAPGGRESLLSSSTLATLVYKTDKSKPDTSESNTCKTDTIGTTGTTGTTTTTTTTTTQTHKGGTCTLVLSGESSMGRVTIGGNQIVIEGIHVTASITNDGTPSYKAAVSVASASIGGIPVTIDQDGVHVAGQGQGLPYKQASDALNSALNKAGIQIFLVQPEVTNCSQSGTGAGGGTTTTSTATTTTTPTTTTDQSGATSSCGQSGAMGSSCDQSNTGTGGSPGVPVPAPTSTQSSTTTTSSPCGQTDMGSSCDQTGTGTGGTSTGATTTTMTPTPPTSTTSTTGNQSSTTTTPGSCDQSGMTSPTSSCSQAGPATGTTTASNDQSATTTTTGSTYPTSGSTFQFGPGAGTNNAGEETVTATGVHIVFTQPVSPSGVPAQFVEHILGEVFVDSLAAPATALPNIPFSSSSLSSSSSSCLGGGHSHLRTSGSGLTAGGSSSSIAGSASSGSGSVSPSASGFGSSSQPNASSTGTSLPARFATALRKPLWLLLAYVVWQLLVIGTGWSLWNWRRGGAS